MEKAGCFTLIIFLISRDCKCSVALLLGAVVWSAVFDCGIFESHLLAFCS